MENDVETINSIGSYTANLLGNIRSHLAGLQGYDVMALELIQNADDAKAEKIIFDVLDEGLVVKNSGQFSYCGDLKKECLHYKQTKYKCDYHRITDVGSGGKLTNNENIGRFGIGFVSTYQITDHPEIRSSGIKLTLFPEKGEWSVQEFTEPFGTSFYLPWADDPSTDARIALGGSHITSDHIERLVGDFQAVLRKSLLFLRHVKTAEIRRNGELVLGCDLERSNDSDLTVSYRPSHEKERWHIIRTDARNAASPLYERHPVLKTLGRHTEISIGVRISPEPLTDGKLYAFLPTEQSSGLPVHINADFFPEADRKALIFAGHQHEQAWNELLVKTSAQALANDLEGLLTILGNEQFWRLLDRANAVHSSKNNDHPKCYKFFWECLKESAAESRIILANDGALRYAREVFVPKQAILENEAQALLKLGCKLRSNELNPFHNTLIQIGVSLLTINRLVEVLTTFTDGVETGVDTAEVNKLEDFYIPLWSVLNGLIPDFVAQRTTLAAIEKMKNLPVFLTEDMYIVQIEETYLTPSGFDAQKIASLLPRLPIAHSNISNYPQLSRYFDVLNLGKIANLLSFIIEKYGIDNAIPQGKSELQSFYSLLADLDANESSDQDVYDRLRPLNIWSSNRGFISAENAMLPGDFKDPMGESNLLDVELLNERVKGFLTQKLDVQTLTIEAFVETVVPTFFGETGPIDEIKHEKLIRELANYPNLLDQKNTLQTLQSLPILPTQGGSWVEPTECYFFTDELASILGNSRKLWLDQRRLPFGRSIDFFIEGLGVRKTPAPKHLVETMLFIANKHDPTEAAIKQSAEAFYYLCDHCNEWKEEPQFYLAINLLDENACFPAEGENSKWFYPNQLYAPYRSEAIETQAYVLDFKNTRRLKKDLLERLGITTELPTDLVISHLEHCVEESLDPHFYTYQILSERVDKDRDLIDGLKGTPCIYINEKYYKPSQLYWLPQQLGRYAHTLPSNFDQIKPFFETIGVKNEPGASDLVEILLDIMEAHFEQGLPLEGQDLDVYNSCLTKLARHFERNELAEDDIERLMRSPCLINVQNFFNHPDELLLKDSEWLAEHFNGELDPTLCLLDPEVWPLIRILGVNLLSEQCTVGLDYTDGTENVEPEVTKAFLDRISLIIRLLHDKPSSSVSLFLSKIPSLKTVSYDILRTKALATLEGVTIASPPIACQAFYDHEHDQLILSRPLNDRIWPKIIQTIFHRFLPSDSGNDITKLTMSIRPLLNMEVDDAHEYLDDCDIPSLDSLNIDTSVKDLTSDTLFANEQDPLFEDVDTNTGQESSDTEQDITSEMLELLGLDSLPEESGPTSITQEIAEDSISTLTTEGQGDISQRTPTAISTDSSTSTSSTSKQNTANTETNREAEPNIGTNKQNSGQPNSATYDSGRAPSEKSKKKRSEHKKQWDRRLLSYVTQKAQEEVSESTYHEFSEHNLAIEVITREAVCEYERKRGRKPEQMSQTHPGYDIESTDPKTGELRFIEVKGINGEWNQTGVGLSHLQFTTAQDKGDQYWLYVVEFAFDPELIRVHPIQSPASQVSNFMFDGNWRDVVIEETPSPALLFIPGARIKHDDMGTGEIVKVVERGKTKQLTILFDNKSQPTPNVSLNLTRMEILEEDYAADDA